MVIENYQMAFVILLIHAAEYRTFTNFHWLYAIQCFFKVWLEEPLSNFKRPLIFLLFLSVLSFV